MLRKTLDRLLSIHFRTDIGNSKLDHMEQDVWRKIRMQAADIALPWYEKMAMAFSVPQFRYASITTAVVLGLAFSPIMSSQYSASANEAMGLEVFASNTPYLLTNQFSGK